MKKIKIVLLGVVVFAFALCLLNLTGASMLLTLSTLSLSFLYFTSAFALLSKIIACFVLKRQSDTDVSWKRMTLESLSNASFGLALIGILFSLSYWVGSKMMLTFCMLVCMAPAIISTIKVVQNGDSFFIHLIRSQAAWIAVVVFLLLMPESFIINIRYHNQPEKLRQLKERRMHHQREREEAQYSSVVAGYIHIGINGKASPQRRLSF